MDVSKTFLFVFSRDQGDYDVHFKLLILIFIHISKTLNFIANKRESKSVHSIPVVNMRHKYSFLVIALTSSLLTHV